MANKGRRKFYNCIDFILRVSYKEYAKSPQDAVLQWMMFLDNPNKEEVTKIMEKNEDIKEAKEDAEQHGRAEGEKENKIKVTKRLYEANMPIEQIAKVVELDISEVKKIVEK